MTQLPNLRKLSFTVLFTVVSSLSMPNVAFGGPMILESPLPQSEFAPNSFPLRSASEQAVRVVQQLLRETKESGVCKGRTLANQCFGKRDCEEMDALMKFAIEPFARATGLQVRPTYHIWQSEALYYRISNGGGAIPQGMKSIPIRATMFHHTDAEQACATTLAIAVGIVAHDIGTHERYQSIVPVEPVASAMGSPGFIEFWWSMLP